MTLRNFWSCKNWLCCSSRKSWGFVRWNKVDGAQSTPPRRDVVSLSPTSYTSRHSVGFSSPSSPSSSAASSWPQLPLWETGWSIAGRESGCLLGSGLVYRQGKVREEGGKIQMINPISHTPEISLSENVWRENISATQHGRLGDASLYRFFHLASFFCSVACPYARTCMWVIAGIRK